MNKVGNLVFTHHVDFLDGDKLTFNVFCAVPVNNVEVIEERHAMTLFLEKDNTEN